MTKNPLSFLFAGFRYLLHGFSAGRLFDRCRFGRLSRRIFWETAAADAVVLLLTFFVPLEIAYRLQLEPESLFLRVWLCTWLILFAVLSVCLFRAARRRLHDAGMSGIRLLLTFVPVVGWLLTAYFLAAPSAGFNRWDRI